MTITPKLIDPNAMNILLLGEGGREHAIAWKLLQSPRLKHLYMHAKNGAIEALQAIRPGFVSRIQETNPSALILLAQRYAIELVVIGPEAPLASGVSDQFRAAGFKVFGASQAAAQLESSKRFAKAFMTRHHIPTPIYASFTDYSAACAYLQQIHYPIVIKASGLASGKGVFLPENLTQAETVLRELLQLRSLGEAGAEVTIETRLVGEELSLLCFTDGETIRVMPPARDYKRQLDDNQGPNTGGMGAFAPVPNINWKFLTKNILQATLTGLKQEGIFFQGGVLYAGLMLTSEGPQVLEFNCRFGDPEAQTLLPLLKTDLLELCLACATPGQLQHLDPEWQTQYAVCIILASENYPNHPSSPALITGWKQPDINYTYLFQGNTRYQQEELWANSGRILSVTALSETLPKAIHQAYQRVGQLAFQGMQYRRDIGMQSSPEDPYASAGVNITAGHQAVQLMTKSVQSTYHSAVLSTIGGFGGLYDASVLKTLHSPILVASTDGVGTKVSLGLQADRLEDLGQDIVHHCVNDILVQNARPLFFMDYIASAKLNPHKISRIVAGMAIACKKVNCALLGGETAEMPGIYINQESDIVGTLVGIVERHDLLPQNTCQAGDIVWGLASSGPHTNGYTLLRKIFSDLPLTTRIPESDQSLADALLAPHRCYLPLLESALTHSQKPIKALAHITGGGLIDNIPRVLPHGLQAQIVRHSWPIPVLFRWIKQHSGIAFEELCRILNMGIGMVIITAPEQSELLRTLIHESLWKIGHLQNGKSKVVFT